MDFEGRDNLNNTGRRARNRAEKGKRRQIEEAVPSQQDDANCNSERTKEQLQKEQNEREIFKDMLRAAEQERKAEQEQERIERQLAAREARAEKVQQELARKAEQQRRALAVKEAAAKEALAKRREQHAREAAATEQFIVLDSSLVTCAAGLHIQHVITGFDLCKITIKGLPRNARKQEILEIFTQQGLQPHDFYISQYPSASFPDAVVLADEECGQAIAIGLEGIDFRGESLNFVVSENAIGGGMGLASRNLPFILVSWNAPSDTIIATYFTIEEAREKVRTMHLQKWNGRQIRVFMNERPSGTTGLRYFNPSSIKIMGLPHATRLDHELFEFLGSANVRTLKSHYFDIPNSFHTIRRHLSMSAGVQMHTYEVMDNGEHGEAKIKVQFTEWEDAKNALNTVRSMPQGQPQFRPWIPPKPLRYSIKISRQQYDAQKKQWDELSEKKKDVDAYVQAKEGDRGDIFIQVLGQDRKATGSLKVRVERMVAGERLDSTCWHSSFMSAEGRAFLSRVYDEKNVYIRHDFKSKSLRVYGEPRLASEAQQMVQEEVDRLSQREITRFLDQGSVGFFVREGLGKLAELLGEENVILNLSVRPCKVTVKGGDEARHHLQRLVDESKAAAFNASILPNTAVTETTCPICTDEASNPEELICGHTYCSGCLKHFLTSAVDSKTFPMVCIANDATCNVPISIPFIKRFLPAQVFHGLVEAAFLHYLEQHSQELKYCTTPDCKQIYRHRTDVAILKCPSCFSTICPACDEEAHEGMTCAERKLHSNPAEQERLNEVLAAKNGYKKCPQCKVWIEKTEGCNHMSCKCGAHICWRCMGVFSAGEIYNHMGTAHGGYFDNELAEINLGNDANFFAAQVDALDAIERERERFREELVRERERARIGQINRAAIAAVPVVRPGPFLNNWEMQQQNLAEQRRIIREGEMARQRMQEERQRQATIARYAEEVRQRDARARYAAEAQRREENRRGFFDNCIIM